MAWLTLWIWGQSPYTRYLGHQSLDTLPATRWVLLVYVAGWLTMIVAMMLPTSLPLVLLFNRLVRRRSDSAGLMALLLAGYLGVWTTFGLVLHLCDAFVHQLVAQTPWMQSHAWIIGAATVLVAGIYQFTPAKFVCLDKCRSPLGFITEHWHGRRPGGDAFLLGFDHGLFCVGCCWALMLIMFAVGMGNLAWMLGLGAIMGVEKNAPWGRLLRVPLGVTLLGAAAGVAVLGQV